jgi:hypothetical protein
MPNSQQLYAVVGCGINDCGDLQILITKTVRQSQLAGLIRDIIVATPHTGIDDLVRPLSSKM